VLDGWLSRKWNQTSEFGSRMDSAADHLLAISMTLWLVLLRPFFFREQRWPLIAWAAFALLVLAISWLKFRRAVDLHLYSSKAAVFLSWCFGIPLLVAGRYSRVQFWITIAACTLAALESLVVIPTRREVDEHIGTLLLPRRSRRAHRHPPPPQPFPRPVRLIPSSHCVQEMPDGGAGAGLAFG